MQHNPSKARCSIYYRPLPLPALPDRSATTPAPARCLSLLLLTACAGASGIAAAVTVAFGYRLIPILLLLLSDFLDTLDGSIARHFNKVSNQGACGAPPPSLCKSEVQLRICTVYT